MTGLIDYNYDGVLIDGALSHADLAELAPRLNQARTEVLEDLGLWRSDGPVPMDKRPLDAGFIDLPERLLQEYQTDRSASQLGRILATAARLRDSVDRVVVLGIGGSYMGARALMQACCHPYHNELSRAERGAVPRLYFAGTNLDNDQTRGLLDLLEQGQPSARLEDQWALVAISKSGQTLETAVAMDQFFRSLKTCCDGNDSLVSQRVVPITGSDGRLADLAQMIGCTDQFPVPDGVGGRFSLLSAVGLFPAAVLGLDIKLLLEGAVEMNQHFQSAEVCDNAVLNYVGVSHCMEEKHGAMIRVLAAWSDALESLCLWYDQLLSESLGKRESIGATPLTCVNTRDLHSRAQQHQEGRRDKLITNLLVDRVRRDPLVLARSGLEQDRLDTIAGKTMPEILQAAARATNQALREDDRRPTADLRLPRVDESSLGQLFQMLMLATAVEGRLIGINPYGQPGVQKYKRYLENNLGL